MDSPDTGRSASPGLAASPGLGPASRSRAGSGSFHLVEVGSNKGRSNQSSVSPNMAVKPAPAEGGADNWSLDGVWKPVRQSWAEQTELSDDCPPAPAPASEEKEGFDPQCFLGEWLDNLGHRIVVTPASEKFVGRRGRRQNGRQPRMAFTASLQKLGVPEKRFTISLDRWQQWRCGNGSLVEEESDMESLTWAAEDGRVSNWERPVPDGPVYFDAPPAWNEWGVQGGGDYDYGQWVSVDMTEMGCMGGPSAASWSFNPQAVEFNPQAREYVPMGRRKSSDSPGMGSSPSTSGRSRHRAWASPKATPVVSPAVGPGGHGWGRTPTPSPMIRPVGSPLLQATYLPDLGPPADVDFVVPPAIDLQLVEESAGAAVEGSCFKWTVADPWGELSKFPKDSCIMSPTFSIQDAHMQLSFYPNGSREAEPGHCSLALSRSPDCPGIKFEFALNGRSTGPKVCLGRRYLGDYMKPFEDSDDSQSQVVVSISVLELIPGR
ncbi:unnamed protein product [Symbiodinium natans]|uniref:Uncharacterized protein n=1 Tax=Symbiodinium natans TaxID=878477 RepID=A0A812MMM0_9DINO|nr:unnamed protein product [Symbiodinium natans]